MPRFYAPRIATEPRLPEQESGHCVRVLRLVEGDEVEVVDGNGTLYQCRITLAHPKRCELEILSQTTTPPHWGSEIVIAIAPTKNLDRMELMAEKTTEMGIDRIIPLLCDNSERRVLKNERLEKILIAAMKQSLKTTLPRLDQLTPLSKVLAEPFDGQRFIAYCDPMLPREERHSLAQCYDPTQRVLILIGPEGDFSPEEVQAALNAGFTPVTLGESRLRTETAAIAACATCHTIKQIAKQ